MIEFLITLKLSLLSFLSLLSVGYLVYLKIIIKFILKQSLLCSTALNMSTYTCEKKASKLIKNYVFHSGANFNLKIVAKKGLHKAFIKITQPNLSFTSNLRVKK